MLMPNEIRRFLRPAAFGSLHELVRSGKLHGATGVDYQRTHTCHDISNSASMAVRRRGQKFCKRSGSRSNAAFREAGFLARRCSQSLLGLDNRGKTTGFSLLSMAGGKS